MKDLLSLPARREGALCDALGVLEPEQALGEHLLKLGDEPLGDD
jgi:hypothetical protein